MNQQDQPFLQEVTAMIGWKCKTQRCINSMLQTRNTSMIYKCLDQNDKLKYNFNKMSQNNLLEIELPIVSLGMNTKSVISNVLFAPGILEGEFAYLNPVVQSTYNLACSPYESPDYMRFLNARSKNLFDLGFYELSLQDLKRIDLKILPADIREDVCSQLSKCKKAFQKQSLQEIISRRAPINDQSSLEFDGIKKKNTNIDYKEEIPKLMDENRLIPNLSDCLESKYSKALGRHVTATRNIERGDLLSVFKIYTTVLKQNAMHIFCWSCNKLVINGIPCPCCPYAIYCSLDCQEKSWTKTHDVECAILPMILSDTRYDESLISLRILIQTYKECGSNVMQLMDSYPIDNDDASNEKYNTLKYSTIGNFLKNYHHVSSSHKEDSKNFAESLLLSLCFGVTTGVFEPTTPLKNLISDDKLNYLLLFNSKNLYMINEKMTVARHGTFGKIGFNFSLSSLYFSQNCFSRISRMQLDDYEVIYSAQDRNKGEVIQ